jgi:predicted transcriptional regulator
MLDEGMTVGEIAKALNAKQAAVSYIKQKKLLGRPPEKNNFGPKNLDHELIKQDLRLGDLNQIEIAMKHNTSRYTIAKIYSKMLKAA